MKRLLATTILAAGLLSFAAPAMAGPAIAVAGLAVAAATAAGTISALTGFALSVGLTVLGTLLQPKPKGPKEIGDGRTHQVREPVTVGRIILGMGRFSGPMVYWHTRGNKSRDNILHEAVPLAVHPITAFLEHYLNEKPLLLDEENRAYNEPWQIKPGVYMAHLWAHDGTQTEADDVLVANSDDEWTESHIGYGTPYTHLQLTYGATDQGSRVFPNGIPSYSAVVLGAAVYDPREAGHDINDPSTWEWTDNAVLAIAHYLTMPEEAGGFGASADAIDWDLVEAEADLADEIVPRKNFSTTFTADDTTDQITLADGDLPTGTRFRVASDGTLPAGLEPDTLYYVIRDGEGVFRVAATRARAEADVALDITSAGTGTHTLRVRDEAPVTVASDADDTLEMPEGAMPLVNGTQVRIESTATPPGGLTVDTDYYTIWVSPRRVMLATTLQDARRRIPVSITNDGTGNHTLVVTGEPAWTINGEVMTDRPPIDVLEEMRLAIGHGQINKIGGLWRIRVGRWRDPDFTITDHDMRAGERVLSDAVGRRSGANGVRGTYIGPALHWQPGDFPPIQDADYVEDDAGEEIWADISLPFTISPVAAQRVAKIDLERRRRVKRMSLPCNLRVMPAWAGQHVQTDFRRYRGIEGWPEGGKVFEVDTVSFGGNFGIDLELSEVDAGIWEWDALTDERDVDPAPILTSEEPDLVDPEDVSATSAVLAAPAVGRIAVTWTFPEDEEVSWFELRAVWQDTETTQVISGSSPADARMGFLQADIGKEYDVMMRAVRRDLLGPWIMAAENPVLVEGDQTPPATPTLLAVGSVTSSAATLSWKNPDDADFDAARIYRSTTDSFGTAALIETLPGLRDRTDTYQDTGLASAQTYYWWVTAVDGNENESDPTVSVTATTS